MDNEQKPVVNLFLRQTLGPVVFRTLGNLMLLEIKRYGQLNANKFLLGNDFWIEVAKGQYKNQLLKYANSLEKQRDDLMAEVMKQYGLTGFSDSTDYHDIFSQIFNDGLGMIKSSLEINNYIAIIQMSQMSEGGDIEKGASQ